MSTAQHVGRIGIRPLHKLMFAVAGTHQRNTHVKGLQRFLRSSLIHISTNRQVRTLQTPKKVQKLHWKNGQTPIDGT